LLIGSDELEAPAHVRLDATQDQAPARVPEPEIGDEQEPDSARVQELELVHVDDERAAVALGATERSIHLRDARDVELAGDDDVRRGIGGARERDRSERR
jgi:hypothetical protein